MPETIIYNQFEYILGATVGPIGGTGATMFATISGLSGNTRYEFILLTYNNFGATIVGPIGITTMYGEPRESIFVWGSLPYGAFLGGFPDTYASGNTLNYVNSSTDLNNTKVWGGASTNPGTTGFTAPDGSLNAFRVSNGGRSQNLHLPIGFTYVYSFYHNASIGNTAPLRVGGYVASGANGVNYRQILPVTAASPTYLPYLIYPNDGITGWRRFAFEFYLPDFAINHPLTMNFIYMDNPSGKDVYYWGPQVEKAT